MPRAPTSKRTSVCQDDVLRKWTGLSPKMRQAALSFADEVLVERVGAAFAAAMSSDRSLRQSGSNLAMLPKKADPSLLMHAFRMGDMASRGAGKLIFHIEQRFVLDDAGIMDRCRLILPDFLAPRAVRRPTPMERWRDIFNTEVSSVSACQQQLAKLIEQALWAMAVEPALHSVDETKPVVIEEAHNAHTCEASLVNNAKSKSKRRKGRKQRTYSGSSIQADGSVVDEDKESEACASTTLSTFADSIVTPTEATGADEEVELSVPNTPQMEVTKSDISLIEPMPADILKIDSLPTSSTQTPSTHTPSETAGDDDPEFLAMDIDPKCSPVLGDDDPSCLAEEVGPKISPLPGINDRVGFVAEDAGPKISSQTGDYDIRYLAQDGGHKNRQAPGHKKERRPDEDGVTKSPPTPWLDKARRLAKDGLTKSPPAPKHDKARRLAEDGLTKSPPAPKHDKVRRLAEDGVPKSPPAPRHDKARRLAEDGVPKSPPAPRHDKARRVAEEVCPKNSPQPGSYNRRGFAAEDVGPKTSSQPGNNDKKYLAQDGGPKSPPAPGHDKSRRPAEDVGRKGSPPPGDRGPPSLAGDAQKSPPLLGTGGPDLRTEHVDPNVAPVPNGHIGLQHVCIWTNAAAFDSSGGFAIVAVVKEKNTFLDMIEGDQLLDHGVPTRRCRTWSPARVRW